MGSARNGRLLCLPSPALAVLGAQLLQFWGNSVQATSPECTGWTKALWAALMARSTGPVTLVMECSEELNKDLNLFTPLVGIQIPPDHAFMRDLAQMFERPLALTSANLSSQASSLNDEEFQDL
ncbi:YrdC domain-containing protein, mitochondrial [Sciurus carolinensis]|uniref:Threonylcarbamoyl-AMP synthase n=1 Tax=Sciurus carolinensis TaxID=30640 RepID=A0AA41T474_SCICA|nr:YrdC domain-containing protein, mitochondrial [Sciurus carolinensis]MBZ3891770.1 YrdC domain-containing protein, mitochondrial [Sciurus carolinensis]